MNIINNSSSKKRLCRGAHVHKNAPPNSSIPLSRPQLVPCADSTPIFHPCKSCDRRAVSHLVKVGLPLPSEKSALQKCSQCEEPQPASSSLSRLASADIFQRHSLCPSLGCIVPPDKTEFLPGQWFDVCVEVHNPKNGSEAVEGRHEDQAFSLTIAKDEPPKQFTSFFKKIPENERWQFEWFEDRFAKDAHTPSVVDAIARRFRKLQFDEPGTYTVNLTYDTNTTSVQWTVRPFARRRKAKHVIMFIGDGMTTGMVTATRMLGHKSINGKYQSMLKMDEFPVLGHHMTHSIDTVITDSANSASALYTGHKTSVHAMGVYPDTSPNPMDDPRVETIVEAFLRIHVGGWGAVTTASLGDATIMALTGHSRHRNMYARLLNHALNGVNDFPWTRNDGPNVFFGGGGDLFGVRLDHGFFDQFAKLNYSISLNKTQMLAADPTQRALGTFCRYNFPIWLERNVFKESFYGLKNEPLQGAGPAQDLPGLKDMTLKAIDILHTRNAENGSFLMVEAASIDKQMHALRYDHALGDLLELDDTVRATIEKLQEMEALNETLILVTSDHGQGFDVAGSVDTLYLEQKREEAEKRKAFGVYEKSVLPGYQKENPDVSYDNDGNFPLNWEPRHTLAGGVSSPPAHEEDFKAHKGDMNFFPAFAASDGIPIKGAMSLNQLQSVHSLTDVPLYAMGPCQETFSGTYNNIEVFFKMANCLGLGRRRAEGPAADPRWPLRRLGRFTADTTFNNAWIPEEKDLYPDEFKDGEHVVAKDPQEDLRKMGEMPEWTGVE